MRRDQYPAIGPQLRHRWPFEFADIDIERSAAQMIALHRVEKGVLVHDLASGDVDEHATLLHRGKPVLVEEPGGLGRPLAADHDEIAVRQKPVECLRPADLAKALRQRRAPLWLPAGANDPHAERGAQPADFAPDPAGADHAGGFALYEERPIRPMIERAGFAIDRRAVEPHREMQNASDCIFGDWQRIGYAAGGRGHAIAGPQIAAEQVAGAGLALMKPFEPRRSGA